ncbi:hypothetical protein cyc_06484 [Cyclospora cayetanensis]|uniref:Uncharacterized protein n=1 Tax=Cyclospora cayetanensis TaxID=88456 RepID=A0A1D3CXQ0_9EIME|nr:hypothetical protein cyc_06484 [Cyclospora cayetanensis]
MRLCRFLAATAVYAVRLSAAVGDAPWESGKERSFKQARYQCSSSSSCCLEKARFYLPNLPEGLGETVQQQEAQAASLGSSSCVGTHSRYPVREHPPAQSLSSLQAKAARSRETAEQRMPLLRPRTAALAAAASSHQDEQQAMLRLRMSPSALSELPPPPPPHAARSVCASVAPAASFVPCPAFPPMHSAASAAECMREGRREADTCVAASELHSFQPPQRQLPRQPQAELPAKGRNISAWQSPAAATAAA